MGLPVYEFEIDSIPDYKMDISSFEFTAPKIEILDEDDALQYGQYIFDEISDALSISIELEPIAIIKDSTSNAWGVSFGDGSIGNGYSIALFSNGDLIAIWPEE